MQSPNSHKLERQTNRPTHSFSRRLCSLDRNFSPSKLCFFSSYRPPKLETTERGSIETMS
ncbi:unnamed protein product [Brassica rapa subsp. narinosa]